MYSMRQMCPRRMSHPRNTDMFLRISCNRHLSLNSNHIFFAHLFSSRSDDLSWSSSYNGRRECNKEAEAATADAACNPHCHRHRDQLGLKVGQRVHHEQLRPVHFEAARHVEHSQVSWRRFPIIANMVASKRTKIQSRPRMARVDVFIIKLELTQ